MRRLLFTILPCLAALLTFAGCTDGGDDGPEEYPELSLGWARLLAEEVRDAELPGGEPVFIFAGFVGPDGLLVEEDESLYLFFFAEPESRLAADGLLVTVFFSGDTAHEPGKSQFEQTLPAYSDAAGWIETADEALETIGGVDYTHRTYEVREGMFEYEPPGTLIVKVDYWWEKIEHKAKVILVAETGEVWHVEDFR